MVPNLDITVFSRNFTSWQIWGCWFQIWQQFFEILTQKYPMEVFWVQNLNIFIFSRSFQIPKWELLLVPNLRIFSFAPNVVARQIQGRWFQIWQYFFRIPVEKYPSKAFLVPNLGIRFFTKFRSETNSRVLISNMTIFF